MVHSVSTNYTDDLDGSAMTAAEATTVSWSWRGVNYEFDTHAGDLAALEADDQSVTLGRLLASSRRVGGRRTAARPIGAPTPHTTAGDGDASTIRRWAAANNIPTSPRGRIPRAVREQYTTRSPD